MIPASEADKLGRVFESWAFDPAWDGSGANAIQANIAAIVASSPEFLAELGLGPSELDQRAAAYQGDDYIPERWTLTERARTALRGMIVRRQGYAGINDGRVFTIADGAGRVRAMGVPYSYTPGRDLALSLVRGLAVVGAAWAAASAAGIATAAPASAAAPSVAEAAGYLEAGIAADVAAEAAALAAAGVPESLAASLLAVPGLGATAGAAAAGAAAGAAAAGSGGSSLLQTIAAQGAAVATKATGTALAAALTQALTPRSSASSQTAGQGAQVQPAPQWQTWAAVAAVVVAAVVAFA